MLAGPTSAERKREVASAVPAGTPLRTVSFANGVATIDLGERFATGHEGLEPLRARDAARADGDVGPGRQVGAAPRQERHPARALPRLRHLARRSRCGTATAARRAAARPPAPGPPTDPTAAVRALQQRLAELSFLPPRPWTARPESRRGSPCSAFQKWQGLGRDGVAGPATQAALATATRPTPTNAGPGNRFEVLLDRQLTLYIENGTVVRTLHVSSGQRTGFETPVGRYSVFRKEAQLLVRPLQGLAALGELLRRRRRVPRVARRSRSAGLARLRPACHATTRSGSTTTRQTARPSPSSGALDESRSSGRAPRRRARAPRRGRRAADSRRPSELVVGVSMPRHRPTGGGRPRTERGARQGVRDRPRPSAREAARRAARALRARAAFLDARQWASRRLGSRARRDHDHPRAHAPASTSRSRISAPTRPC